MKQLMIIFIAILLSSTQILCLTNKLSTLFKTNTQAESELLASATAKTESKSNSESMADFRYKKKADSILDSFQPSYILGKDPKPQQSYWEGWVSYIHYDGPLKKIHKHLFKNTEYFHQRLPISNTKKKDKYGPLMIPNKSQFFMVVNPTALQIFTSRRQAFKHQWDSLEIKYIKPVPEDNFMKGGVHDLHKLKMGYCFDLRVSIKTKRKSWLFCLSDQKRGQKLMKAILRLKLKIQRKHGKFNTQDSLKVNKKKKSLSLYLKTEKKKDKVEKARTKAVKPLDGRWNLMWDWSQCSLKCGGGESHQQWQCMPPKNGGKPCLGKAIRVKKCNSQPCPGLDSLVDIKKTMHHVNKPIIKVGTFSKRLQRYEKCIVKDNDAYSTKINPKTKFFTKMPMRLVMNNMTITIYKDDDYQNVEHSYNLDEAKLVIDKKHHCCFKITDDTNESMVCGYDKYCGSSEGNEWANGWNKDFALFKNACKTGRYTLLTHMDELKLAKALKKKINDGNAGVARKRSKQIKEGLLNSLNKKNNPLKKAHDQGFMALQKELSLEKLIKKEENEREKLELASMAKKIENEKEKADCLNRSIKEKKLDAEILNERRNTENEAKEFKKDMSKKVLKTRKNFKKMVNAMRAKTMIRKAAMARQLAALKSKMAADVEKANKIGDIKKCKKGKIDKDYRSSYCDKVFIDDFVRNGDCKSENFCYSCCEHEFGNMHIDKRENCYNMCDANKKKIKKKPIKRNNPGLWNWK